MTPGRRLAAGVAALALLAGCSQAGARRAEPPATTDKGSGVDAARTFRSARGYTATPEPVTPGNTLVTILLAVLGLLLTLFGCALFPSRTLGAVACRATLIHCSTDFAFVSALTSRRSAMVRRRCSLRVAPMMAQSNRSASS